MMYGSVKIFSKEPADEPRREDLAGGVGALLRGSGGRLRHQPPPAVRWGDGDVIGAVGKP